MTDQISYLPISALRESPFNPRKAFAEAELLDLAESIKSQGVLQPIVVRPLPEGQADIEHRYEIVFGHRRFRACRALPDYQDGTLGVPAIVREMDDQDAAIAQVAENMQRADVSPLEEADSLARLHREHNLPADRICERIGKSRSYVYNRIKLANACAAVRDAITTQGLPAEVAVEVARLRGEKLQTAALKRIKGYGDEWQSYRTAKANIKAMFSIRLTAAPFDLADAGLAKLAGPCTTCSKRAGNDPDLAELDADVCTDADCYGAKVAAHAVVAVAELRRAGAKVLTGEEAQAEILYGTPPHVQLRDFTLDRHAGFTEGAEDIPIDEVISRLKATGHPVPEPVWIEHPKTRDLMRCWADADIEAMEADWDRLVGNASAGASTPSTAGASASGGRGPAGRDLSDWTEAERTTADVDTWHRVKEAVLRNLAGMPRTADDLRAILLREWDTADGFGLMGDMLGLHEAERAARAAAEEREDDDFDGRDWVINTLARMAPDELAALLLGVSLEHLLGYGSRYLSREEAAQRVALAERYGVDVVAAARPEQSDDADGCAVGGRDAAASTAHGDLFTAGAGRG